MTWCSSHCKLTSFEIGAKILDDLPVCASDWDRVIAENSNGVVSYCNAAFGNRNRKGHYSIDYLMILFPHNVVLEVMWDLDEWKYSVVVSENNFKDLVEMEFAESKDDVVRIVGEMSKRITSRAQKCNTSDSGKTNNDDEHLLHRD